MIESFFTLLNYFESFVWTYVGFILITILGCYFTYKTRFFQVRILPIVFKTFFHFMKKSSNVEKIGTHPLKAFFASVGGMIGVGGVVGIVTAVQFGGPGALFWVWIAGLVGAVIKYSEIFLGLKHRVANNQGGYDGGPMYFLQEAFNIRWIGAVICILMCIYGVEIYQFTVITESLSSNFELNKVAVMMLFLALVLYTGGGGVSRVGKICGFLMPFFTICYIVMSLWVIGHHIAEVPGILQVVVQSAFTGHAAVGGFAGSTALLALQYGISKFSYSADIGIGYDSIIQSESRTIYPERQARLAVLGVFIDNIVCTVSILVVLTTGVWEAGSTIEASHLIQTAFSSYFPYMNIFMPLFLFLLGYTTIIAYFCAGMKCAKYLHPGRGILWYFVYAIFALTFFSFYNQLQAFVVMSVVGSLLLILNLSGIFFLRREVEFHESDEVISSQPEPSIAINFSSD